MSDVIRCSICGETHRDAPPGDAPSRCAACGARLDASPASHSAWRSNSWRAAACGGLVAIALGAWFVHGWLTRAETPRAAAENAPAARAASPIAAGADARGNPPPRSPGDSSALHSAPTRPNVSGGPDDKTAVETAARGGAEATPATADPPASGLVPDPDDVDPRALADYEAAPKTIENSIGMKLVLLPPVKLTYSKPYPDRYRTTSSRPLTDNVAVVIPRPIHIGACEVTREQFEEVMGYDPSWFRGPRFPVHNVSWHEAMEFCRRLSALENATYRLPSDAEWEHAARDPVVPRAHLASPRPIPVAAHPPNGRGLHDLRGGVAEWCVEPWVRSDGVRHSARGGGYTDPADLAISTHRRWPAGPYPTIGFRVVREFDGVRQYDPRLVTPDQRAGPLIERFEQAFASPPRPVRPGVLIFPGTANLVRSLWAQELATYPTPGSPEKAMDISPEGVRRLFLLDRLAVGGPRIDQPLIDKCLAHAGVSMYAIPRLREGRRERSGAKAPWLLTVECQGGGADRPDRTFECRIPDDRLVEVSGRIALAVLEYLEVEVTPEQRAKLLRQPPSGEQAGGKRGPDFFRVFEVPEVDHDLSITPSTAHMILAWNMFLTSENRIADTLHRPGLLESARRLGGAEVALARHLCLTGKPDEAVESLLELVPSHRGDPIFHETLVRYAMEYEDRRVVERFFDLWRDADPGYRGLLGRGELGIEWAAMLRHPAGRDVDGQHLSEFRERMRAAQRELEAAAEANPLDWRAHTLLIRVARELGLSREYALARFEQALRHDRPIQAYHEMHDWFARHGSDRDLLVFAKLAAESNLFKEGVGAIVTKVIDERAYDANDVLRPDFLRMPELADALRAYFDGGQANFGASRTYWWYWSILSGHPRGPAARIDQRLEDTAGARFDAATERHCRDIAIASGPPGAARSLARARVALADGDFDRVEHWMRAADDEPEHERSELERLRRALELARRLRAERSLAISPRDMLDTFAFHDCAGVIEEDRLVCRPTDANGKPCLICPFGFGAAEISGTLSFDQRVTFLTLATRTQAAVNPLLLSFRPQSGSLEVWRRQDLELRRRLLASGRLVPGPQEFRVRLLPDRERIEVGSGFRYERPVAYDGPGGFAIDFRYGIDECEFQTGSVRIELLGPDPVPPKREWDVPETRAPREIRRIVADGLTVTALALSPAEDELLVARMGGVLSAHDPASGRTTRVFSPRSDESGSPPVPMSYRELSVMKVRQGEVAATTAEGRRWTWEWGNESSAKMGYAKVGSPQAWSRVSSPRKTLRAGTEPGTVELSILRGGIPTYRLEGHRGRVSSVAFSPDGDLAVTAADGDPTIRVWDASSGALVRELVGHESGVLAVAFSPDGRRLLSGGGFRNPDGPFSTKPRDNSVRLWDVASGRQLLKFDGHDDDVTSLLFLPEGGQAATGSRDGTVRLWDVTLDE
ncbi:MAG: SUMF1/EgtB/PvdO family nonheme iron enzyme [Planctomycetaceae bacterium]